MRRARADVVVVLQPALHAGCRERAVGIRDDAALGHEQIVVLLRIVVDLVAGKALVLLRAVDIPRRAHVLLPVGNDFVAGEAHVIFHGDDISRDRACLRLAVVDGFLSRDALRAALHEHIVRRRDDARAHVVLDRVGVERSRFAVRERNGIHADGQASHNGRCQKLL